MSIITILLILIGVFLVRGTLSTYLTYGKMLNDKYYLTITNKLLNNAYLNRFNPSIISTGGPFV